MTLGTVLIILLILFAVGVLPTWGHSRTWGYVPSGGVGLLVLIVINVADVVFAVDSIPAIFGITTDRFIVYTSNIFAILGLRTFFFVLVELAARFRYLKYGIAFVLSFIGVKMLLPLFAAGLIMLIGKETGAAFGSFLERYLNQEYERTVIDLSLGIVAGTIALSALLSWLLPQKAADRSE